MRIIATDWMKPEVASTLLWHISGMQTGGWNHQGTENRYFCNSSFSLIGHGFPLANNIAYYGEGTEHEVETIYLELNIHVPSREKEAKEVLIMCSEEMLARAVKIPLTSAIKWAIRTGESGKWLLRDCHVELTRENWASGQGYGLRFSIT